MARLRSRALVHMSPLFSGTLTFAAARDFFCFFVALQCIARLVPVHHRQRITTASIWVPVVSMLLLFFPLGFNMFISYCCYRAMREYRTILFEKYSSRFSPEIAADQNPVLISAPLGNILIFVACSVITYSSLALYYYLKFSDLSRPLFLYDFFGLHWAPFGLCLATLTLRLQHGSGYLLMFIWLSWIGDASAYFMGKKFGKHKCAPNVSPGKTWEGVAAEYTTYIIGSAVMSMFSNKTWLNIPAMTWTQCFGLALVLGTMGVLGDLLESFVKRVGGAKDSGDMFPGHGGVLDRFDSFYLAGPLLTLLTFTDMLTP